MWIRLAKGATRSRDETVVQLLRSINRNIEILGKKLDRVVELQPQISGRLGGKKAPSLEGIPLDVTTLLSLPDHLRKTAMAIASLGEATATEVAKETERVRAVESDYLNQLVSLGHVKKKRKGRDVYFYLEEE